MMITMFTDTSNTVRLCYVWNETLFKYKLNLSMCIIIIIRHSIVKYSSFENTFDYDSLWMVMNDDECHVLHIHICY